MFSKLSVLVFAAAILASVGQAATIEDAEKFCQSEMTFSSDKLKCITEAHAGRYYHTRALNVCRNLPFTRDKLDCLQKIRNKSYTDTLINTCQDMTFSGKIVECLAQFGTIEAEVVPVPVVLPPPSYPTYENYPKYPKYPTVTIEPIGNKKHVRKMIRKALRQMDNGNFYAARQTLEGALQYGE